jgi:hypothetical protein
VREKGIEHVIAYSGSASAAKVFEITEVGELICEGRCSRSDALLDRRKLGVCTRSRVRILA